MHIQAQLTVELQRRTALLPSQLDHPKTLADANQDGMGIHQSQILTITELLDELLDRQRTAVAGLAASLPPEDFAARRVDVEQLLTGTHSVMATFRYVFTQRRDSRHHT